VRGPAAVYLYLLGQRAPALRLIAGTGELVLARDRPLPLARIRAAAASDGFLAVDPWIADGEGRAIIALWTYAADRERALAPVPRELAPQLIVHAPIGAVLVWLLPAPYPETPGDDRPAPDRFLAELAEALGTIPAGTADTLPVPVRDTDLVVLDRHGAADPAALWAWAHETAEARRAEARRAAEEAAAMEAEMLAEPTPPPETGVPGQPDIEDEAAGVSLAAGEPQPEVVSPAPDEAAAASCAALGRASAQEDTPRAAADAESEVPMDADDDGAPEAADGLPPAADERFDAAADGEIGDADGACALPAPEAEHADAAAPAETAGGIGRPSAPADLGLRGGGEAAGDGPRDPDTPSSDDIAASAPDQGARADLPAPLRRLLAAAAQRQRVSPQEALAEAVLAHGVAVLGTREAYALLGVLLTWKRADGLYALTPAREWRPIAALPSRSANRLPPHHGEQPR